MASTEIKSYKEIDKQVGFEALLAEISTLFINLPIDQIDREIENVQRRICEILEIERSTLWQMQEGEPETLLLTHIHQPPGSRLPADRMDLKDFFPWIMKNLMAGEIVAISKMSNLPAEAKRDLESFNLYASKSGVYVPLSVGQGTLFGVLSFASMYKEREWSKADVRGCTLLAQVFSNTLARKKTEMALRESEARLTLTTNAAEAGLWSMDIDTGSVWGTEKTRELFHFAPDEQLTEQSFFKVMHLEDRERVRQIVQQAIQTGENFLCDFRIVIPGGKTRWIAARGRRQSGTAGGGDRLLGVSLDISNRKRMEKQLETRLQEIEELKHRLEEENIYLQEEVKLLTEHSVILGQSTAMKNILTQAGQVAETDSTVLIMGKTGTGKELLARAIHSMSLRKDRPLVTINCASLPPSLIENELFGREKGAYTGAMTRMIGRFELADNSTLFLDEIGELPPDLQGKLLRVLEEGTVERLGSTKPLHINVRIIAATNRDIEEEVANGRFRPDLFYRLNVFPIVIPPLCERSEDIPLLTWAFIREFQKKMGKQIDRIPRKTMQILESYQWPGNIRELRNVIERAMIMSKDRILSVQLPRNVVPDENDPGNFEDMMRREILAVLERTRWRVAGRDGAAEILGLKRSTLYSKMKKLGIRRAGP